MQFLDVEWKATTDQMIAERDGRDAIEERSRVLRQRVKEKSVDDVGDEIHRYLALSVVGLYKVGHQISYHGSSNVSKGSKPCGLTERTVQRSHV